MKRFLISFLVISIGINVIFLQRKIKRTYRWNEEKKLLFYKEISYEQGYEYFLKQIKKNYPEANINNKYFIVYRWDSLHYDGIYREQMMALDSMANSFGKYTLEYVFVTEMEERASMKFLERSQDEFKNVKMLYGMDDYISGLHNIKDLKLVKPKVINSSKTKDKSFNSVKQLFFYSIMDSEGKFLYTNEKRFMIVKDTAFLNKLNGLLQEKNLKILN